METLITEADLARRLPDILNRVRDKGERFVVQRRGTSIATIAPVAGIPHVTVSDIIAKIGDLYMPGEGFADDLEAVQAEQGLAEFPEWPED